MSPVDEDSVLLPLSDRDAAIGGVGLTVAFVLNTKPGELDVDHLRSAIERVVDKWRLLSGRVVYRKELGAYGVLAPLGPLPPSYKPFDFSLVSTPDKQSPFAHLPSLTPASGHLIPLPSISSIKSSTVPSSAAEYAKTQHPITAWQVSVFSNATIVSLSTPHAVFDAHGLGIVLKALEAELHGRSWEVPPLNAENQLEKRLKEVSALEFSEQERKETPPPMRGWTGAWPLQNVIKLLANGAYESLVHKAEDGCVFVGRELLEDLVKTTKAQVQEETGGKEFVSEGDILVNWFYKAIYQYDPSPPTSFFASCAVSLRELVATEDLRLDLYPHNAVSGYSLSSSEPLSTSEFLATPLWKLALAHRRMLTASRTLPAVAQMLKWVDEKTSPAYPAIPEADCSWAQPWRKESTGYWIYSSQIAAGMASITFPHSSTGEALPLKAFLELGTSLNQLVAVNQLDGVGWFFTTTMRRTRWRSIERTVEEAEKALRGQLVAREEKR